MRMLEEFENTCREFPAFRAAVVKARDVAPDPGTRAQLDHLLNSLDKTFADFKDTYPKAANAVQQRFAKAEAGARQANAKLAEAKATLEQQKAAAAAAKAAAPVPVPEVPTGPPPLPEIPPIDLNVGLRLRDALLKRFGDPRTSMDSHDVDREIWEDWEGHGSA